MILLADNEGPDMSHRCPVTFSNGAAHIEAKSNSKKSGVKLHDWKQTNFAFRNSIVFRSY